jgi:DNA processing protein
LVSGLARGIDGRAHQGALNGARGGAQVAVLPCALDAIHPRMHEELAEAIVARGGLLLTEQPPGVQVERWMFASRNRILTGLAPTTVVIQSPARGGSLISARCAFDQDREVFALWQKGMGASWSGNRALVADELAVPVADVNALWRAISEGAQSRQTGSAQGELVAFPEGCREVWDALDNARPTTWDQLRKTCEGRTVDLERQLFTLEMLGWIRRLPGRAFLRN